ncbi:MAG: hypothetical protein RL563_2862 [Pseudomonadota bacterium]
MKVNRRKTPQLLALAVTLAGCEYIGPQVHTKMPLPPVDRVEEPAPQVENKDISPKTAKVELFPGETDSAIGTSSIAAKSSAAKGGKGEYSLNFDDADLGEVAKVILSDILGRNYTISPQVTGKVTLQTTHPLSKEELMPTLEMLLNINNAALVSQGDLYLIKPSNEAVYSTSIRAFGNSRIPSGYQLRVIPVRNVAAAEIADILKPLLPEKSLLHVDANRNILLVSGSSSELSRIMEVVGTFDVDVLKGRSFALFTPAHVDAQKIITELEQIFIHKSAGAEGKEASKDGGNGFFRFIEIERLNAILAITHNERYLHDIESWVLRLDRTNADAGGGVNVYRAQHVSAIDLADTLNGIFGTGSGYSRSSRSASIASGRKSRTASNKQSSSGKDSLMDKTLSDKTQDKSNSSRTSSGGSGLASGSNGNSDMHNVKIIADEGNNALIIVSSSEEYAKIQKVIKQLDVLPLQVMIDATIVEVTLNDDLAYGIQWYLTHNNGGTNIITGGARPTNADGFQLGDIAKGLATGGFSYAFSSNSKDINAILKAEATNNNINVISSPSLMVLNNQEASIKVGDSVPIRTSQSTNTNTLNADNSSDGVVQTSGIEMLDTGVNLSIRPRVNAGGLVLMDILQTVNNAAETKVSGIDSPTIQKREIESSVAIQSGETIVLGGLIKEDNTYNRFGVPLLHEIPLIGPLFGSTTRNKDKSELVVLITPRVVTTRQDASLITDEFRRKLSSIYDVPRENNNSSIEMP